MQILFYFTFQNNILNTTTGGLMSLYFPATIDSLFDSFFDTGVTNSYRNNTFGTLNNQKKNFPNVNIYKTEEGYQMEFAVPGYSREDFDIGVNNGNLYVRVETEDSAEEKRKTAYREYSYTSFQRSFQLGTDVEPAGITSRYDAGILYVNVPFAADKKPTSYKIQVD
jgi:HSP20 family protein